MTEDVLLFANPIAGKGRGRVISSRIWEALTRAGFGVRAFLESAGTVDAERIRGQRPARAAIAVGGDGTLRTVAERLIETFSPADIPPLLVVPLGTANLMGKHLSIVWRGADAADRIVAAIQTRKIVQLDTARANGSLFLLMAGVGFDGHVVHELARVREGPIDLTSYALPAALAFQRYTFPPLRVEVDGKTVFEPAPAIAFVGNIAEYGTGFPILSHARSDDGLLDICVLPCRSRSEGLNLVMRAAAGEHLDVEGVVYTQGVHVKIDSDQPVAVQLDGDAAGHTPLEIALLPVRLPFIVP